MKNNKKREIKNKVIKVVAPIATVGVLAGGIAACRKNDNTVETINIATPTPTPIEEVAEEVVTPEFDMSSLDVTNSDSVDNFAEQNYLQYQEFYVKHGITKQDIIEMILTINDRYTNEDGELIITADQALNAYTNLATILKSDDITQTIDNIHFFMNGELSEENLEEIELLDNQPNIISLIDTHIEGSEYTIESINEYQELRDNLVGNLNAYLVYHFDKFEDLRDSSIDPATVMPYNAEEVNNYLFDQEIYEYNNDRDDLDNVITNGYRWLLDASDKDACDLAAQVNPNVIRITDPATDIDLQINYDTYRNNRFRQYEIFTEADTVNYVITANYNGLTELIPEEVVTEYIRIMTVMPYAKHFNDICNIEEQTVNTINEIGELSNTNTLTLTN